MRRTCVLIVLDGWGIGRQDFSNPLHTTTLPNIEYIKNNYPSGALQAAGIAVGLPWNEEGNSEVGHLTIGAGKIIYQHYPRITLAIQNGNFFKNSVLNAAVNHVKKNKSTLQIATLLTEGNIHASFEHLEALLQFAKQIGLNKVGLHLFSDGKDSRPKSAPLLLKRLYEAIAKAGIGQVASFSGRFYALDRDSHWDRTERAYRVMLGEAPLTTEPLELLLQRAYEQNQGDPLIDPVFLGPNPLPIQDGDALFFADFREDSIRQITSPFVIKDFPPFKAREFKNLFVATMTEYSKQFKVPVAFPAETINTPLGRVLSEAGKTQMLIAETEKYAHVTYFFNGYRDEYFKNQFPILIPSQNVSRHDEHPEMMAAEISKRIIEALEDRSFDFILANFANADIVAHTGNYEAATLAIQTIDTELGKILKAAQATDAVVLITSDHGNVEVLADPLTGMPETSHDLSPVPVYLIGNEFKRVKNPTEVLRREQAIVGILADVAPTILEVLKVPIAKEMTGHSLIKILQ